MKWITAAQNNYSEADDIATEFMCDIITTAMSKYDITFDKLVEILVKIGYWEMFNDTNLMVVGAHHGMESVLEKVEGFVR